MRRIHVLPSNSLKKDILVNLRWSNFIVRRLCYLNEQSAALDCLGGNELDVLNCDNFPFSIDPTDLCLIFSKNTKLKFSINLRLAFVASTYDLFDPRDRNLSFVSHEAIRHLHLYMKMRSFIFFHFNRMLDFVNMLSYLNKCYHLRRQLRREIREKLVSLRKMKVLRFTKKRTLFYRTYRAYVALKDRLDRLRLTEGFTSDLLKCEFPSHENLRLNILYK